MKYRNTITLDFDAVAEAMADEVLDVQHAQKVEMMAILFPLLVESLGSWQALDAIGGFDGLKDDPESRAVYDKLWLLVPVSRGGGANRLQDEVRWNEMIAEYRKHYQGLETELRQQIDQKRREAIDNQPPPESGAERDARTG